MILKLLVPVRAFIDISGSLVEETANSSLTTSSPSESKLSSTSITCICKFLCQTVLWCKGLIIEIAQPLLSSFTHIGRCKISCSWCFGHRCFSRLRGCRQQGWFREVTGHLEDSFCWGLAVTTYLYILAKQKAFLIESGWNILTIIYTSCLRPPKKQLN